METAARAALRLARARQPLRHPGKAAWSAWPECPCRSPRQERADQVAAPLVPAEPSWPHHRQATSLSDRKAATTSRAQPPGDKFAKIPSWLQLLCPCHSSCTLVLCPCHSSCTLVIPRSTATRNLQCSLLYPCHSEERSDEESAVLVWFLQESDYSLRSE